MTASGLSVSIPLSERVFGQGVRALCVTPLSQPLPTECERKLESCARGDWRQLAESGTGRLSCDQGSPYAGSAAPLATQDRRTGERLDRRRDGARAARGLPISRDGQNRAMTETHYAGRSARDPDWREAQIARPMEREHQRRGEYPRRAGLKTGGGERTHFRRTLAPRRWRSWIALDRPSQRGTTRADRLSPHDEALRPERRTRSRPAASPAPGRTRRRPTLTPDTSHGGRAAARQRR